MHQVLNVQGSKFREQEEQTYGECGVAEACHDKCFACCANVGWVLIPEADEQEAAEADALPSEIQQKQIVCEDERDHRRDEEVHIGEEARIALVVVHVFSGIEMNEEADKGYDEKHQKRDRIEIEGDLRLKAAGAHPCPEMLCIGVGGGR